MARQSELVKAQQTTVRTQVPKEDTPVDVVRGTGRQARQRQWQSKPTDRQPPTQCYRCGRSPSHEIAQCPARNAKFFKCNKTGHFRSQCKSTRSGVDVVHVSPKSGDDKELDQFLGVLLAEGETDQPTPPWTITLTLNKREMTFKIDTGADISVIPVTKSGMGNSKHQIEYSEEQISDHCQYVVGLQDGSQAKE